MLAAKLILDQGIEVIGISFESPFFNADRARTAAKQLGIPLITGHHRRAYKGFEESKARFW